MLASRLAASVCHGGLDLLHLHCFSWDRLHAVVLSVLSQTLNQVRSISVDDDDCLGGACQVICMCINCLIFAFCLSVLLCHGGVDVLHIYSLVVG